MNVKIKMLDTGIVVDAVCIAKNIIPKGWTKEYLTYVCHEGKQFTWNSYTSKIPIYPTTGTVLWWHRVKRAVVI